ncbi:MAG TPA: hypothetical protein VF277_09875, partial [Steroidobacteraceae bacterium]
MLDANLKQQLGTYLQRVTQPVELVATLDDSDGAREMRALLEDVASLSDKVRLVERGDDGVRVPSFRVNRVGSDLGIRFAGVPLGHEFT